MYFIDLHTYAVGVTSRDRCQRQHSIRATYADMVAAHLQSMPVLLRLSYLCSPFEQQYYLSVSKRSIKRVKKFGIKYACKRTVDTKNGKLQIPL